MSPADRTPADQAARSQAQAGRALEAGATVSLEFDLAHAPAKVWRALTDPALLAEWLLPVVGLSVDKLGPGVAFTLQAPPQPGWDGVVNCRIREIEPQRRLSYTWLVGDPATEFAIDTVVTFTLTPTATGTRLSLVQAGFKPDQKQALGGARYGWKMMGGRLGELLAKVA